jgi:hypothetical protein
MAVEDPKMELVTVEYNVPAVFKVLSLLPVVKVPV